MMKYFRLGEILVSNGLITDEQLEEALGYQKVNKKRLGETLVELGFVSDREINETLAKKLDVEFIESPLYLVDDTVARLIPESIWLAPTISN